MGVWIGWGRASIGRVLRVVGPVTQWGQAWARSGRWLIVPAGYGLLTLVMTWPLALHLDRRLPGLGDALMHAWLLAWDAHALRHDPTTIWQAPIFYPYPMTLAYTDHHLVLSLLAAPVIWVTDNPVLAYNLLLLLSFILTGWGIYALANELTRQPFAAFIAGAAFTFGSFRMAHLLHLQLEQTAWLPWSVLFLHRLLRSPSMGGGRWRDAWLCGLFLALQATTAVYYAFFAALVFGLIVAWWAVAAIWRRWRYAEPLPWFVAGRLLIGTTLTVGLTVPFILPYLGIYQSLGIVRSVRELDNWSAPVRAYLAAAPGNLLNRLVGWPPVDTGEMVLWPGLPATLLAVIALLRRPGSPQLLWALIGLSAVLFSFGTGIRWERGGPAMTVPLPYLWLYEWLPGFGALRVPARWGLLVSLVVAILMAFALARWLTRPRPAQRALVSSLLLTAVLLESAIVPLTLTEPLDRPAAPVYRWLAEPAQADIRVILELPVARIPRGRELDRLIARQYYGRLHWKASPVGYSGLIPFGTTDLLARVQRLPEGEALRYLQLVGIDTIILHRDEYADSTRERLLAGLDSTPLARRRAEIGSAIVYQLEAAPELMITEQLSPAAGSIYISADERAPGLPALAFVRRWQQQGLRLYGAGRPRYYGPLTVAPAGEVYAFGLLAAEEDPAIHGFTPAGLRWRSNGLAFYAADPDLQARIDLGRVPAGAFHPVYPATLDLSLEATRLRAGELERRWSTAVDEALLEIDLASLTPQVLSIGSTRLSITAGATTIRLPVSLGQSLRIAGEVGVTALRHLRLRSRSGITGPTALASGVAAPLVALRADSSFEGSRLRVTGQAAASGLMLDVWGAAALDDRPIHLLLGQQPLSTEGQLHFEVDLLQPAATWLRQSEPAADGRYIAYLKDPARPSTLGLPVAKFVIRDGRVVNAEPVPLPLTVLY